MNLVSTTIIRGENVIRITQILLLILVLPFGLSAASHDMRNAFACLVFLTGVVVTDRVLSYLGHAKIYLPFTLQGILSDLEQAMTAKYGKAKVIGSDQANKLLHEMGSLRFTMILSGQSADIFNTGCIKRDKVWRIDKSIEDGKIASATILQIIKETQVDEPSWRADTQLFQLYEASDRNAIRYSVTFRQELLHNLVETIEFHFFLREITARAKKHESAPTTI